MHPARLQRIADHVIRRAMEDLPRLIREAAAACPTEPVLMAAALKEEAGMDADLLGLFEGLTRAEPLPEVPDQFPRIRIFVDNLWDYAGGNLRAFREEVRITYLHELGHYLGFDEEGVEELGLG